MIEPGDCRNCRDYRGCLGKDWYDYGQVRWCPLQVLWIIAHREELKAGCWPKDPDASGDDNTGSRTIKTEASFVKPELIVAELEVRLGRVGLQAELLICQVDDGRSLSNLTSEAREVLMYVGGSRRKRQSFSEWKKQRRWLVG